MTAISNVAIANRALSKLGEDRITSFADDSKPARAIAACFDIVRDAELRRRRWKFALTRTSLAALADAPAFGYAYAYQLPADCLRVWSVGDAAPGAVISEYRTSLDAPEWQIEGRTILTDYGAPLKIRYTSRVEDPQQFDAAFVESLAARLAMECADELTGMASRVDKAMTDYNIAIREAVRANAIESAPDPLPDDEWVLSRA
jgi:hypothetical protein